MENPCLMHKDEINRMLSKIEKKVILDASEMSISDRYLVCRILAPDLEKEWVRQKKNYSSLKDGSLSKTVPNLIAQMFLNTIWWETYGADSYEYNQQLSERMRLMKSIKRHTQRLHEENAKLEKKIDDVMEEKGMISQKELDRLLEEQKEKYNQMLDDKYIENRNKYKTLQKQVSDLKSQLNHTMSTLNQVKLENEHLRKENAHFESMDT